MQFTDQLLAHYVGGQLEVQNLSEGYIYRGEIERAWVEKDELKVRFKWFAQMKKVGGWQTVGKLDYSVSTFLVSATNIGDNRIFYNVMGTGESGTFFPPEGSRLDPSKVEGLQLAN